MDTDAFLSTTVQRNSRGVDSLDTFVRDDPLSRRCNVAAGFPFPGSAADNPTDCVLGFDGDQQNNTAWAVFAQASFDLSDSLELTLSARYDEDSREQTLATPDVFLRFFL